MFGRAKINHLYQFLLSVSYTFAENLLLVRKIAEEQRTYIGVT